MGKEEFPYVKKHYTRDNQGLKLLSYEPRGHFLEGSGVTCDSKTKKIWYDNIVIVANIKSSHQVLVLSLSSNATFLTDFSY